MKYLEIYGRSNRNRTYIPRVKVECSAIELYSNNYFIIYNNYYYKTLSYSFSSISQSIEEIALKELQVYLASLFLKIKYFFNVATFPPLVVNPNFDKTCEKLLESRTVSFSKLFELYHQI